MQTQCSVPGRQRFPKQAVHTKNTHKKHMEPLEGLTHGDIRSGKQEKERLVLKYTKVLYLGTVLV